MQVTWASIVRARVGSGEGNSHYRTVSNRWAKSGGNIVLLTCELTPAFEAGEEAYKD